MATTNTATKPTATKPTMNTLPTIIRESAAAFAALRGAEADASEASAAQSVRAATAPTLLSFVATPDGATVTAGAVRDFAAAIAVLRTAKGRDRVLRREAQRKADELGARAAGEQLARAMLAESR